MKAHLDGDSKVFAHFEQIRDIALSMRQALLSSNWTAVGQLMTAEWEARKQLTPGITTETIDQLIFNAQEAGALGAKICGAGGGFGCLALTLCPTLVLYWYAAARICNLSVVGSI